MDISPRDYYRSSLSDDAEKFVGMVAVGLLLAMRPGRSAIGTLID